MLVGMYTGWNWKKGSDKEYMTELCHHMIVREKRIQ